VRDRLVQIWRQELFEIGEHQTYITDYEDLVLTRSCHAAPESFIGAPSAPDEPVLRSSEESGVPAQPGEVPGTDEECAVLPRPREILL